MLILVPTSPAAVIGKVVFSRSLNWPINAANFDSGGGVTGSRAIVGYCHGVPAQNKQRMVLDLNSVRQKWPGLSRPVACRTKSFFRRATTGDL